MNKTIQLIKKELKEKSDEKLKISGQRFFKEKIKLYGIKTADVTEIAKKYFNEIKDLEKEKIFDLCEELWKSGYLEESFIACHWSYSLRKKYQSVDFQIFEKWIYNYINNWASCDTFCNHTIGYFLELYPNYLKFLKKWAKSPNLWVRRASVVSLIIPAKKGMFSKEIFELADILLLDKEDLVQKGYGWVLKALSQAEEKKVFDYIMKNKSKMPRTALRYAIEKMPKNLKKIAMER
jgi:3-methyladenine DNA glycosylase AlkD